MKKHPNTLWAIGVTLLVAVLIVIDIGGVPAVASSLPRDLHPDIEVEPALQSRLVAGEDDFGYLIYFRERPDLSPAYEMDWESRGRYVVTALQATAQESQKRVKAYLEARGVRYKAFWVDNIIAVLGGSSAATFNGLMGFPEVQALRAHRQVTLHDSLSGTGLAATGPEPNLISIGADQVWALGYTGEGITVANIDTGVQYNHEALVQQYRGNLGGGTFDHNNNWWDTAPDANLPDGPTDESATGHGTHTMGIMVGDDGEEHPVGVAPGASWIACRAFEGCGEYTTIECDVELLECGQFMLAPWDLSQANPIADLRPHIVNNSWGDCSQIYDDWFQGVVTNWHAAGIYPVFSNGNASTCGYDRPPGLNTVHNPARYGDVTGVGAAKRLTLDLWGNYYDDSNMGPTDNDDAINPEDYPTIKPQVVAPGQGICSSVNNGSYGCLSGTSQAAPHVAGLVALMWEAAPCLIGDYAATETILLLSANHIDANDIEDYIYYGDEGPAGWPNHATGWGSIDALAAVQSSINWCQGDKVFLPVVFR